MSLDAFATLAASKTELETAFRQLRAYLASLGEGALFESCDAVGHTGGAQNDIEAALAVLVEKNLLVSQDAKRCPECGTILPAGDVTCDLCPQDPVDIKALRLVQPIPAERPWYSVVQLPQEMPDLQQHVLRCLPRFIDKLQSIPPVYLKANLDDPASNPLQEGDFRDEAARAFAFVGPNEAESLRRGGRTDLILRASDDDLSSIICEFKVWPRNDYQTVIEQLADYFTDSANMGLIFMVNPNKSSISSKYLDDIIKPSPSLVPGSIVLDPLVKSGHRLPHYVSKHTLASGRVVDIYHFLFNTRS
jgi:hypothetical protein